MFRSCKIFHLYTSASRGPPAIAELLVAFSLLLLFCLFYCMYAFFPFCYHKLVNIDHRNRSNGCWDMIIFIYLFHMADIRHLGFVGQILVWSAKSPCTALVLCKFFWNPCTCCNCDSLWKFDYFARLASKRLLMPFPPQKWVLGTLDPKVGNNINATTTRQWHILA